MYQCSGVVILCVKMSRIKPSSICGDDNREYVFVEDVNTIDILNVD